MTKTIERKGIETIIHGLEVARDHFREDAKICRGDLGVHPIARERLGEQFDRQVTETEEMIRKLEDAFEIFIGFAGVAR